MSKRSKSNRWAVPLMVVIGAAAGTVGLALYVKMTPADRVRPQPDSGTISKPAPPPESGNATVLIPIARMEEGVLRFDSEPYVVSPGSDLRIEAVNRFLRTSKLLPEAARLQQLDLEDGEANLFFSAELESGQGSFDEATLIQGLRAVLGQFPEVRRFRLFADGQEVRELGHFELGDPIDTLPVNRWREPESSDVAPPPSMPR